MTVFRILRYNTPFTNQDDACVDIDSKETISWSFDVTADCSNIVNGVLEVPSCRFWEQPGANEACSGLPGANEGTRSKCDCTPFEVTVPGISVMV
jgi:hypothetical protein